MSTNTERVRYYDGEYLRSADFTAEQNYHVEMRRRLNRALHLWGIVDGLELIETTPVPNLTEISVSEGMAIDGFGRELLLAAPKELTGEDFAQGEFHGNDTYLVWARYRRSPETPAASGYRLCNAKDQLTRWQESIDIFISNKLPDTVRPTAADAPPDDSKTEWPVLLGAIEAEVDLTGGAKIVKVATKLTQRKYVGLRAQHLTSPTTSLHSGHPDLPLPLLVEANLRAQNNILVGNPTAVDPSDVVVPAQNMTTFPGPDGNVFCEKNLFLGLDLYKRMDGKWLALAELIKAYVPEVQFRSTKVTIASPDPADQSNGSVQLKAASLMLAHVKRAEIAAWIGGVEFNDQAIIAQIMGVGGASQKMSYDVLGLISPTGPSSIYDVELKWSVGPTAQFTVGQDIEFRSAIVSVTICYAIVFYP